MSNGHRIEAMDRQVKSGEPIPIGEKITEGDKKAKNSTRNLWMYNQHKEMAGNVPFARGVGVQKGLPCIRGEAVLD